jgi:hypothetical protein
MNEIIVGNIGTVLRTGDNVQAQAKFREYVAQSKDDYGRAAGESVYWMKDGEILKEHLGKINSD